ncbi:MAG: transposase, partial [Sphaerochaeta sp.]|nr:transposase [Sphaerochaeta sp.]
IDYIMRKYLENKIIKSVSILDLGPDDFRMHFSNPEADFTRFRRQSFRDVVKVGLLSPGSCMKENLRHCFGVGSDRPSASAYIQQRDKLGVQAYRALFDHLKDPAEEFTLVKDKYLLVACDGSDINIHPNKDDAGTLVYLSNNPNGKVCNQLHLNALCAVPDGYFLDYIIQEHREMNEALACEQMLERHAACPDYPPSIISCDRGYECYRLMMRMSSLGLYFCIRAKDINSRSISQRYRDMAEEDGQMDAMITRKYTRCYTVFKNPGLYPDYVYVPKASINEFIPETRNPAGMPRKGCPSVIDFLEYSFRLVRLKLSENSYEVLLTNLPETEFSTSDLKELYHLRWGVETAFRQLKYDDCSSFSNTRKKVAAIGEIILSMIFHNICTSVLLAFGRRLFRRRRNRKLLYKVSYSDLAKTLRLYASGRDPTITIQKIVKELAMTIQPVRSGRAFSRILKPRSFTPFIYRAA